MTQVSIRQFEKTRGPRNHNVLALKQLFESHSIPEDDALMMSFRVVDLIGPSINSTPSAFLYRKAEEQISYWREFHV